MLYVDAVLAAVVLIIGYLLGSVNFSIIIGRVIQRVDVREYGSKNAGTTNTLRVLGKKAAFFVLLGDVFKCFAAVVIGNLIFSEMGGWLGAVGCVLGHVYPLYFGFKGGKGVATGISMMAFTCFYAGLGSFIVFLIVLAIGKMVSLASLSAFLVFPVFVYLFTHNMIYVFIAVALCVFVFYLHRENIKRISQGKESKVSFKK